MDWDRLRIFHTVATSGSFTAAARKLNLAQSSISRQVMGLEDQLKAVLFNRHARGLVLTSEGEELFQTVDKVLCELENVERRLLESKDAPSGPLRVTTTVSFGSMWLARNIGDFIRDYPDIDVSLMLTDDEVDLAHGDADVAIRFRPSEQADLIQRQILPIETHLYASPDYLAARGTPAALEDLDEHDLIVYGHYAAYPTRDINWILKAGASGGKRKPILEINNIYGVVQAVESGLGLASVPDYLVGKDSKLVRILPDVAGQHFHGYFVYPRELRGSKRVLAFRDYLISRINQAAHVFAEDMH